MDKKPLAFDNIKVEFMYPFKIAGWRTLRQFAIKRLSGKDGKIASDGGVMTDSFVDTVTTNSSSCPISPNLAYMEMLAYNLKRLQTANDKLLWANCHSHERRGTRPYCVKDEPFLIMCFKGENLDLIETSRLPDLRNHLKDSNIRVRSTVKIQASGFGQITLKFHILTRDAIESAVYDMVYSSVSEHDDIREKLCHRLMSEISSAIKYKVTSAFPAQLSEYALSEHESEELISKLSRFVEEVTVVDQPLSVSDIVDLQNIDRGSDWGLEPHFIWDGSSTTGASKLYHYYLHLLEKEVINRIKEAVASNSEYADGSHLVQQLHHSVDWHAAEGEYPYVLTTFTVPEAMRGQKSTDVHEPDHMNMQLNEYRQDLARLLMKSKWKPVRADWGPIKDALNNVFYSDLLYMAVHLRGALCAYYVPTNPREEYSQFPELLGSSKYREEFKITLSDLRVLWYIYTMHNQLIQKDMAEISEHYEELRITSHEQNFSMIIDGLHHIITTIEDRKVALAEVMEDPLCRRGGSSLFTEMLDSASHAFRLKELHDGLKHKLERLDMLGLHVSEGIHEASNLIVGESSRGAQTTLEILESLIVGVYAADLTMFAAESYEATHHHFPFPLEEWWSFVLVGSSAFAVAMPWVTLIRKYRTRIKITEPPVQEKIEGVLATAGPLGLATIIYLFIVGSLRLDLYYLFVTFSGAGVLIGLWWMLTDRYLSKFESTDLMRNISRYSVNKKE